MGSSPQIHGWYIMLALLEGHVTCGKYWGNELSWVHCLNICFGWYITPAVQVVHGGGPCIKKIRIYTIQRGKELTISNFVCWHVMVIIRRSEVTRFLWCYLPEKNFFTYLKLKIVICTPKMKKKKLLKLLSQQARTMTIWLGLWQCWVHGITHLLNLLCGNS